MLPLKQYTIEDYFKFRKVIDKALDEHIDNGGCNPISYIRFTLSEIREMFGKEFPHEMKSLPSVIFGFMKLMMNEMDCKCISPCGAAGVDMIWFDITSYEETREYLKYKGEEQ